jgi:site-specific DNA-methyltransferase (adenine-specific)
LGVEVILGDCRTVLAAREGPLFDGCACDPPYHLTSIVRRFGASDAAPAKVKESGAYARASAGFMGQTWDGGDVAFLPETWRAVFDQLKPGAHLVAFAHTRNYHRMACAIEDAGFEIRDQLAWAYGTGFPKSHHVGKAIDRMNGDVRPVLGTETLSNDIRGGGFLDLVNGDKPGFVRNVTGPGSEQSAQWEEWGTAFKPAWEPIVLARKPLDGTIAENVLRHGTGALNIGACRIEALDSQLAEKYASVQNAGPRENSIYGADNRDRAGAEPHPGGRWPANILTDGSDELLSRYFYSAKADDLDRLGSQHATVKPVDVMRWLCRLICPPGGLILDPFAGSGTTGIAALCEGINAELIELQENHVVEIRRKLEIVAGRGRHSSVEINEGKKRKPSAMPLFDEDAA